MDKGGHLSVEELCAIIKTCGESGVRVIKFPGFYVSFGPTAKPSPLEAPNPAAKTDEPVKLVAAQTAVAAKAHLLEEIQTREEQLAMMMIENPVEAEKLILAGELEDAKRRAEEA